MAKEAHHCALHVAPATTASVFKMIQMMATLLRVRGLRMMRVVLMVVMIAMVPSRMTPVRLMDFRLLVLMVFAHHSSAGTLARRVRNRLPPGDPPHGPGPTDADPVAPI